MLDPGIRAALTKEAARFDELQGLLADPEQAGGPNLRSLLRESGSLQKRVLRFREYLELEHGHEEAEALAASEADPDMIALAQDEAAEIRPRLEELAEELKLELLSSHELSGRNVILEIRAGVGGDEATLWTADLSRMYQRFAERQGLQFQWMQAQGNEVGGFKEVSLAISGEGAFDMLRFESGGHRVQRVPSTEAQGRIHTSAATVAVLAEPEEIEVEIKPSDLKMDTFRAGGPGGQNVNKVSSAVRITHEPSGLVVSCQDESSQHKNKAKALRTLRSRLFDVQRREQKEARDSERRDQIGSGDRGDKIRTYNYPQDRVTDHRIQQNFHPLPSILDGQLVEMIDALRRHEIDLRLEAMQAESCARNELR